MKTKNFKNFLKGFGILVAFNLFYLNVVCPITISIEQVYFISVNVVIICNKRGLDVNSLSPTQLDKIISLSVRSIKETFQRNGFRFIPPKFSKYNKTSIDTLSTSFCEFLYWLLFEFNTKV